jgi:dTDP-4-dehydrorhamnose reductase
MFIPKMNKPLVGVIGGNGVLGQVLVEYFDAVPITRDPQGSYNWVPGLKDVRDPHYDLLINANGSSNKWFARTNQLLDWEANVTSVYRSLMDFKYTNYTYISSIDASSHLKGSVYSFHKKTAEQLVMKYACNYNILRCGALLGGQKKGAFYDMANDKVMRISRDSTLTYISTREVAFVTMMCIIENYRNRTMVVTGRYNTGMRYLERVMGKTPRYVDNAPTQSYYEDTSELEYLFPNLKTSDEYVDEEVRNEGMVESIQPVQLKQSTNVARTLTGISQPGFPPAR